MILNKLLVPRYVFDINIRQIFFSTPVPVYTQKGFSGVFRVNITGSYLTFCLPTLNHLTGGEGGAWTSLPVIRQGGA